MARTRLRAWGPAAIVAAAGLILSAGGFLYARVHDGERAAAVASSFAQVHAGGLVSAFTEYERLLSEVVTTRGFATGKALPLGLRAVEWVDAGTAGPLLAGGRRVAGYDPAANPSLAVALVRARDTGVMAASGLVGPQELVLVLPAYRQAGRAEAGSQLVGYAALALGLPEVLSAVGAPISGLAVSVLDLEAASDLRLLAGAQPPESGVSIVLPIEVGGRRWEAVYALLPNFAAGSPRAWWVLATGLLATILLSGLVAMRRQCRDPGVGETRFLATLSRDLRDPLNTIIGFSELMTEQTFGPLGDPKYEGYARDINESGRFLLHVINDIIDYSALQSGSARVTLDRFAVAPLLEDVAAVVDPLMQRRGNALTLRVGMDAGEMLTDMRKLRQILFNLLSNAAKFTEGGQVTLEASRERGLRGDLLVFAVTDTGIGMTPEQMARLFRFTPRDLQATRSKGGTGIGLMIVRLLCELMGGSVTVDSRPGEGTRFTVKLPAKASPPDGAQTEPEMVVAR